MKSIPSLIAMGLLVSGMPNSAAVQASEPQSKVPDKPLIIVDPNAPLTFERPPVNPESGAALPLTNEATHDTAIPVPTTQSVLKPSMSENTRGSVKVEGPARRMETPVIDAEEISVPPSGMAWLLPRAELVPDPFCSIESSLTIRESGAADEPRCCHSTGSESGDSQIGDPPVHRAAPDPARSNQRLTAVFSEAAHFSTGTCHAASGCSVRPPFVIYEGMTVTVDSNGCYEVRGIVDGPRIPAILRLQLTFQSSSQQIAIVTLPPIRLVPEVSTGVHLPDNTQTWFVRRTGFSDVLRQWPADEIGLSVRRSGVARTGQVPEP